MLALQIDDKLNFMKKLLTQETFDKFLLVQGSITTFNTFTVDGHVHKEFYGEDFDISPLYEYEYTPWGQLREWAFSLIKGKYTPSSFSFVMHADKDLKNQILSDASDAAKEAITNLALNIRYDSHGLTITTATAADFFLMDKTADELWDEYISKFIRDMQ